MGLQQNFMPISFKQTLPEAFPDVDSGHRPFGNRVIVQIRTAKSKSAGGVLLTNETRDTVAYNTQVGKIVALGPVAFRSRTDLKPWPEGEWAKVGDFVRIPKYNSDRWERPIPDSEDNALFALIEDLNILGGITCDPRDIIAFI